MITAIILCRNEEKNLPECIDSVSFCNEIIVVDDSSHDNSLKIAKEKKVKIVSRLLENDFSNQRNYALDLARNEWVLFVDADERVSLELQKEIIKTLQVTTKGGFYIKRLDSMFGKILRYGELRNKKFLRLAKKDSGKWVGKVHEEWMVLADLGTLKAPLFHYPHQTFTEFISEINMYTSIRANELFKTGKTTNWILIIIYTQGKFFYTYFFKLGFMDGVPGLLVSLMMSFHTFLVRGKLYLLHKK